MRLNGDRSSTGCCRWPGTSGSGWRRRSGGGRGSGRPGRMRATAGRFYADARSV